MRTVKRDTNTTCTHRVGHDGGRHRTPRAPAGSILCAGCGAVYENKHWTRSATARLRAGAPGEPTSVRVCPGCRRRESGVPHGFLHVDGAFVPLHRDEILRLLHNETSRAAEDNPLGQVLDWGAAGLGASC